MTRITWNGVGQKFFETGVDRGVFYPLAGAGVAWGGLISIEEVVAGGEQTPLYFDGLKYLDVVGSEDFQANLTAYSAPPEFNASDGIRALAAGLFATQQPRSPFGLCYRTLIGNDVKATSLGYKLHVVYNITAAPSGRASKTMGDSVEPETRSWTINTVPPAEGLLIKPTAHLIIDSTKSDPTDLVALENLLYGTASTAPQLPTQTSINTLLS